MEKDFYLRISPHEGDLQELATLINEFSDKARGVTGVSFGWEPCPTANG